MPSFAQSTSNPKQHPALPRIPSLACVQSMRHLFNAVKSAFSEAGTGSFWSQQRETNGHSDRSSNLENLNSDDMIAGHSITGSVGGALADVHCLADCVNLLSGCGAVRVLLPLLFSDGVNKPLRAYIFGCWCSVNGEQQEASARHQHRYRS